MKSGDTIPIYRVTVRRSLDCKESRYVREKVSICTLSFSRYPWLSKLGTYEDYRDPLVVGLVPLPLPLSMAVHFPLPCKVRYVVGEPVYPAENLQDAEGKEAETELARRVAESMERLIEQYGRPARSTEGPNFE